MHVSQFPCPHCSTNLRVRDRMFVGKIIGCPDCGGRLEIVSDGPKRLTVRVPDDHSPPDAQHNTQPPSARETQPGRQQVSPHQGADDGRATSRTTSRRKKTSSQSAKQRAHSKSRKQSGKRRGQHSQTQPAGTVPEAFPRRLLAAVSSAAGRMLKDPVAVSWIAAIVVAATIVGMAVFKRGDSSVPEHKQADAQSPAGTSTDEQQANRAKNASEKRPSDRERRNRKQAAKPRQPKPPVMAKRPLPKQPEPAAVQRPVAAFKPVHVRRGEPVVDVESALSQKVLLFENQRGAPLQNLLGEVEELAGVPFRIDADLTNSQSSLLERRVTIKLENATVQDILQALLDKVQWTYTIENDGVSISADASN